jgi:hypothetical protein
MAENVGSHQSYVGWAKAPGTADRIHEGGARLCSRSQDARLARTAWAKSRGAQRRHISRAKRFCPPYDERDMIRISETAY